METERPNVVVLVVDTLRPDHLSTNGYFRETDPTLSSIAEEGVVFEEYYASGIATGLAFTSIITGMKPITSGYYANPWNVPNGPQLDDDIPTMAEHVQSSGYRTAAVDNLVNFRSHVKQFVRGYEYYLNPTRSPDWEDHYHVSADDVNGYVLQWLEHVAEEPFFLFVHYWDPHLPYNQPEDYRDCWSHQPGDRSDLPVREAAAGYEYVPGWGSVDDMVEGEFEDTGNSIDLYDGEIRYVDARIGAVYDRLEERDLLDDTVLAILGDHGEQLGQDGLWDHEALFDSVTNVPLILRGPGLPEGERVSGFAEHADLLPTVLDCAGIDAIPNPKGTPSMDGESLLGLVHGRETRDPSEHSGRETRGVSEHSGRETRGVSKRRDRVILETHTQRALRTADWKYIHDFSTGESELYHVGDDPMEREDLSAKRPEKASELRGELLEWVDRKTTGVVDPQKRHLTE